jgi:hypothetical protein
MIMAFMGYHCASETTIQEGKAGEPSEPELCPFSEILQ